MSSVNNTFAERVAQLLALPVELRIAALGDALLGCSSDEAGALAPALLELAATTLFEPPTWAVRLFRGIPLDRLITAHANARADRALASVAAAYTILPPDLRQVALAIGAGRWSGVCGPIVTHPLACARRSLAVLARDAGDANLAPCLPTLLLDADRGVVQEAERTLVVLAVAASEGAQTAAGVPSLPEGDDTVCGAVAEAVSAYSEHRRRGALIAGVALASRRMMHRARRGVATPGAARLAQLLDSPSPELRAGLASVVASSRLPQATARAVEWAGRAPFAEAAQRRFVGDGPHPAPLGEAAHLLTHPARVRACGRARRGRERPGEPPDRAASVSDLSPAQRRGLCRAAYAGALPDPGRILALMMADAQATVRHAAARAAEADLLRDFCLDPDERVATSALLRLEAKRALSHAGARWVALLARSPHPRVRAVALANSAHVADRRTLLADPAATRDAVLRDLVHHDAAVQASALTRARRWGLAPDLIEPLAQLAAEPVGSDPARERVVASAIAALGEAGTPEAMRHAARGLSAPQPRIRANALDAVTRRGRTLWDRAVLAELKSDPHHRVRGAALRAIFAGGEDQQRSDLMRMLADDRPEHRLAAVWVASRTPASAGWDGLSAVIAGLAQGDPDPRVRRRADTVRLRFLARGRGPMLSQEAAV
jgi:HEAT repeat protein